MEKENEPKPGYLGPNLEGHQEAVPPMAWEKIETELDKKSRNGLIWWLFGAACFFCLGLLWNFHGSNSESGKHSIQNKTARSYRQGSNQVKITSERTQNLSLNEKNEWKSPLPESGSSAKNEAPIRPFNKENVIESPITGSNRYHLKIDSISIPESEPAKESAGNHFSMAIQKTGRKRKSSSKRVADKFGIIKNQVEVLGGNFNKKTEGKNFQSNLKEAKFKSVENKLVASSNNSRVGQSVNSLKGNQATEIPDQANLEDSEMSGDPDKIIKGSKYSDLKLEGRTSILSLDSIFKLVSKPVLVKMKTEQPQSPVQQYMVVQPNHFWMFSLNAGLLQQRVKLPNEYVKDVNMRPTPVLKASVSWMWSPWKSVFIGPYCSLSGTFQKLTATILPTREDPFSYSYGPDSLTFVAKTDNQPSHEIQIRNDFSIDCGARFQWQPTWFPVGFQGAYRLIAYKFSIQNSGTVPVNTLELSGYELGIWLPFKEKFQFSLDGAYLGKNKNIIAIPFENEGQEWAIFLGFQRKF